jgi:hypothetical protein
VASTHGKVLIELVQRRLGVALRDDLDLLAGDQELELALAYVEELDVVEEVIVEGKVIAGYDIDASVLLDLPVLETQALALLEQIVARQLLAPVSLIGLFQLSVLEAIVVSGVRVLGEI